MKTYRKVALIFTLLLTVATNLSAATQSEIDGLVALYDSTDGANWDDNENWKVGDPCENGWYGVSCDSGNVTSLELEVNNLTGNIPPEIGSLTNLTWIQFSYNELTGPIPTTIEYLTNLLDLNLQSNNLTGSIPAEIGSFRNLYNLYLNNNNLTGSIPATIGNLTNLNYLGLSENDLSGEIPIEIQSLTKLLGNLGLDLSLNCNLYSNDEETQSFIVLTSSSASYADFLLTQGHCPQRDALLALYNSTGGDNWTNNRNWKDGYPCIDSWDGVWCVDGSVTGLVLGTNKLTGFIPAEIGNLTNLEVLDLSVNSLTGSIPTEIGLTNLNHLYLSFNSLTGFIPAEIGNLTNLTELKLSANNLTGSIPSEIGNLTNLGVLFLSHNRLTGSIPTKIGDLTNLLYLHLDNNYLSGEIPSSIVHTALVGETSIIGYGLTLEENCGLYSENVETRSFILSKTSYSTYDEFSSDQNHCLSAGIAYMFLLLLVD